MLVGCLYCWYCAHSNKIRTDCRGYDDHELLLFGIHSISCGWTCGNGIPSLSLRSSSTWETREQSGHQQSVPAIR
jgi:hypothetical protein